MAAPLDATVVASSDDGLYFPDIEYVFEATGADTWEGRRARLNSVFEFDSRGVATYDGGRTFYDNYEEWTGLATTDDLRTFERVPADEPWILSFAVSCCQSVRPLVVTKLSTMNGRWKVFAKIPAVRPWLTVSESGNGVSYQLL